MTMSLLGFQDLRFAWFSSLPILFSAFCWITLILPTFKYWEMPELILDVFFFLFTYIYSLGQESTRFFILFYFIKGQTVNIFVLGAIWPLFLLLNCHGGMEVATDIT